MTYKITFEYIYPREECFDDIIVAYVSASDFNEAIKKVEKKFNTEDHRASIEKIEVLEAFILI